MTYTNEKTTAESMPGSIEPIASDYAASCFWAVIKWLKFYVREVIPSPNPLRPGKPKPHRSHALD
jgi:hypothetical protein